MEYSYSYICSSSLQTLSITAQQWQQIPLSNVYMAPDTNELTVNGQLYRPQPKNFESRLTSPTSYKLKFPSPSNTMWFRAERACQKINNQDVYRNPQICLRSDYIPSISGLSFLGKVDKTNIGSSEENHFAIFFHEKECSMADLNMDLHFMKR